MLGAALRDKARVLPRAQSSTERVDGGYVQKQAPEDLPPGPLFRCLYDPGNESESRDDARIRRVKPATILVGTRDTEGNKLDIQPEDQIEIISTAHGTFTMEVNGAPTVIPKRRTIIGYTVNLQKVKA